MNLSAELHRELLSGAGNGLLTEIGRGIEKEGLRVERGSGMLAQTPHPKTLGSALTHPSITTDYSEALLEFITPVSTSIDDSLGQLRAIHQFTASQLGEEILWGASMPCIVAGEQSIPIAHYGRSNVGTMKRVYRNGLGERYGRMMQAIAGIHYNFSMPEAFWQASWEQANKPGSLQHYKTTGYLDLIRNFFNRAWLLIYLTGASPAVCASFLAGNANHPLQPFDASGSTLYLPYATSLRMGDLGYNSNAQASLQICYNRLENYIRTLHQAIVTPHAAYAHFDVTQSGEQAQLNDSLLQIENEFYSPIRPKRVTHSGEAPLVALQRAGIEYIEVRCVDINPFMELGIDAQTIRLIDTFLLDCLLTDSPPCDNKTRMHAKENLRRVVDLGRDTGLQLTTDTGETPFGTLANRHLDSMARTAELLDRAHGGTNYSLSVAAAKQRVADPASTPSGKIIAAMRDQQIPFWQLALNQSRKWHEQFLSTPLEHSTYRKFSEQSERSLEEQKLIEDRDTLGFTQYLDNFYAQYNNIIQTSD